MRIKIASLVIFTLFLMPEIGRAQNCCSPAVSQQGVLGETTALPHTLEMSLHYEHLRSRGMYEGSSTIDDPRDTKSYWRRLTATMSYGILPGLGVVAVVPYTWKEKSTAGSGNTRSVETADGLGDVTCLVRFSPLGRSFVSYRELSVGLGLKLPTGDNDRRSPDGPPLIPELQPGTGSWDYIGSLSYYQGFEPIDFILSATYVLTTAHGDYESGNQFSYQLTANYHLGERLDLSAALSGLVRAKDRNPLGEVFSTGRHQLWIVPGLQVQVVPEVLRLQVYYQEPIYQHFNGEQLGSDYNIRLTVAYSLPLKKSAEDDG